MAAGERAYVAYRVDSGVAVTVGEPMGDPAAIPELISDFEQWSRRGGLTTCWWHVTESWLPELRHFHSAVSQIGGYALVDLAELQMDSPACRDLRAALRRLPALGYSAHWYDLAADALGWDTRLQAISSEWLARRRLPEISHSIGTWHSSLQQREGLRCMVLVDHQHEAQAFMTFAPLFCAGGGCGLDLLRGRASLPRDSMLFLLASAIRDFQSEGLSTLSLGLAPLSVTHGEHLATRPAVRRPSEGENTPLLLRAARRLAWQHSHALYNFSGLARFKQRLHPRWEPRYVVYPSLASLPRVLRALCHVHGLKARMLLRLLGG